MKKTILFLSFIGNFLLLSGQEMGQKEYVRANYGKFEYQVPMRDGVRLFTAVYVPNDRSRTYPILLYRTPYSSRPYGPDRYRSSLGPTPKFARDGYIFVYQDVRGRYMSEGEFVQLTPHLTEKSTPQDIDESTDTYDTIEWLITHLTGHNGRVGQWGISYPGFYTAAGMIDSHPALKAASPQAPVGDFYFDDFHHHGAFFLAHAFTFFARHAKPRPEPTTEPLLPFKFPTPDGYQFFLDLGPLSNLNRVHLKGEVQFWNQMMEHSRYDSFWSKRGIVRHLKNVRCAVMTVGGWFDAEDLYGPLEIYRSVERNNPDISNLLVMGPWAHGDWGRRSGSGLGNARFGFNTSDFYRERIIRPFFRYHLKGEGRGRPPRGLRLRNRRQPVADLRFLASPLAQAVPPLPPGPGETFSSASRDRSGGVRRIRERSGQAGPLQPGHLPRDDPGIHDRRPEIRGAASRRPGLSDPGPGTGPDPGGTAGGRTLGLHHGPGCRLGGETHRRSPRLGPRQPAQSPPSSNGGLPDDDPE